MTKKVFDMARQRDNPEKLQVNSQKVYLNISGDEQYGYTSYSFSRYLGDGWTLYGSMIPYQDFIKKKLKKEISTMAAILASANWPQEVVAQNTHIDPRTHLSSVATKNWSKQSKRLMKL